MARKRVGKIDTETILLLGVGAIALYFIMKPSTPVVPAAPAYNPYLVQSSLAAAQGNTTGGIISAGGQAAGSIINALGNL